MAATKSATVNEVTDNYLSSLNLTNLPPPEVMESELLAQTCAVFEVENSQLPRGQKWTMPQSLFNIQIARLMAYCGNVVGIAAAGFQQDPSYDLIGVYISDGEDMGIYATDSSILRNEIAKYNSLVSSKDIDEIVRWLHVYAKRVVPSSNPCLLAVNNGIFDYEKKQLLSFSPEYVFLSKSHTDYNPNAKNVIIDNPDGTTWDVESWMNDISDDSEIVELLWQVIGAVIRPHVRWDKLVLFYCDIGSNGKGSLCRLMRNLLGEKAYATIPLSDFGKDFRLEPLTTVNAVIVDENDVGVFIDKAADLKAVITGDEILINRKFLPVIKFKFHGLICECVNELPRIKDRTDSVYRRLLCVPFEKSFRGAERKYIKEEYLNRREVLEYVLFKVLNMNYSELSEPPACIKLLDTYKQFNDPVRQFVDEVIPECRWDLLPYTWLYALYCAWFTRNNVSGKALGRNTFLDDLRKIMRNNSTWMAMENTPTTTKKRADKYMTEAEPLTIEYGLNAWYNPEYSGNDSDKIAIPPQTGSYIGLFRKSASYMVSNN